MDKTQLLALLREEGYSDFILQGFEGVNLEQFVLPEFRKRAWFNEALPIGFNSTISQPSTIAFMLEKMELESVKKNALILEIGSGSGYVLALLDALGDILKKHWTIVGIEIIPELVKRSRKVVSKKVQIVQGNNYPIELQYDRIVASAAFKKIPEHLFPNIRDNGMLVCPIKTSIFVFKKIKENISSKEYPGFVFVPMIPTENFNTKK